MESAPWTKYQICLVLFHQPFKQHNRLQSAAQVGGSSYPHPMRKKIIHFSILSFPPRQFRRDPASSYQPTTQSPSFHKPRHTIQSQSCPRLLHALHVLHGYYHFVYFVVQFFASFAFFAAEDFTLMNQFYSSPDSSRRASFRAGFLRVSSTAYTFTKPSDSL